MKLYSDRAMTLMELLVTSVAVGIVTMGLIAAEQSTRLSRISSARDTQLSAYLQSMMLAMRRDASLTYGDYSDTGIFQNFDGGGKLNAICFRRIDPANVNSYTGGFWFCWTLKASKIYSCSPVAADTTTTDCSSAANQQTWDFTPFSSLGLSVVDKNDTTISSAGRLSGISVGGIKINLYSAFDSTQAAHPIQNPDYSLQTTVDPVGLSR